MTVAFVAALSAAKIPSDPALAVVLLATTGFGHVTGKSFEGDPHHPPNSSLIAFLGL